MTKTVTFTRRQLNAIIEFRGSIQGVVLCTPDDSSMEYALMALRQRFDHIIMDLIFDKEEIGCGQCVQNECDSDDEDDNGSKNP